MYFPVCTRETAISLNTSYFKRLPQTSPGTQKHILGPVIPDYVNNCSSLIIRRRVRKPVQHLKIQGRKRHHTFAMYYVVATTDYCLSSLSWATGRITEGQAFTTQALARKAQRAAI